MKKWHKRTLFVLTAGFLGTIALGFRPAFTPDEAVHYSHFMSECALPDNLKNEDFSVTHSIELSQPHAGTLFANGETQLLTELAPTTWNISVQSHQGKLTVSCDTPILHSLHPIHHLLTTYTAGIENIRCVRQPNGKYQQEFQLCLSCHVVQTPSFWQTPKKLHFIQYLTINLADKSADLCPSVLADNWFARHNFRPMPGGPMPNLPARYCNSPVENAMLRLLNTLAACTQETHRQLTPRLIAGAHVLKLAADTKKPWPDCWGTSAAMARSVAYNIGPTLEHLEQNKCFGNQQLINFINSEDFSRIFGENFSEARSSHSDIDLSDMKIEYISNENQ